MGLSADEKEKIMAKRLDSGSEISGMLCWKVSIDGNKYFTFISNQCRTPEDVEAAMIEKFGKEIKGLDLL